MDYIKEAKRRTDAAGSAVSNNPLDSMEYNMAAMAAAQIAIAEQLRLANRIALASSDRIKRSDIAFSRLNVIVMKDIPKMFDITSDIPDDVANLLGLDEDTDTNSDTDNGVS